MAQQTATTAPGLSSAARTASTGRLVSTASDDAAPAKQVIGLPGEQSRAVDDRDDPFAYQAGARRTIAKATQRQCRSGLVGARGDHRLRPEPSPVTGETVDEQGRGEAPRRANVAPPGTDCPEAYYGSEVPGALLAGRLPVASRRRTLIRPIAISTIDTILSLFSAPGLSFLGGG